jgi:ketosteroid isomerase-like protein
MSQENVEIARAALAAWNAGNWDAMRELYDPSVVWRPPEDWPEGGPIFGLDACRRQFEQLRATWDDDTLEPISDFIHAADRVIVRFSWRAAGHGPELNLEVTNVFTLRKEKIILQEVFRDHAQALEAVGLSEQDAHADS